MSVRAQILWGLAGVVLVATLAYFFTQSMGLGEYHSGEEGAPIEGDLADMTPGQRLCAAQTTTDSIKQQIFEQARNRTSFDAALLSRLETGTIARMENPRLVNFDEGLEEARCEGRLVLDLPRGTAAAFDGNQRLATNIVYYAEPSSGGGNVASRMEGDESLVGMLAAVDLSARSDEYEGTEIDGGVTGGIRRPNQPDYDATGLPPPLEGDAVNRPAPPKADEEPENLLPPVMQGGTNDGANSNNE